MPAVSSARDEEGEDKGADESAAAPGGTHDGRGMIGNDVDAVGDISWDIDFSALDIDAAHASPPEGAPTFCRPEIRPRS